MVRKLFPDVYKKTELCQGCLFLQDGCPVQNSVAALKAMKKVKAYVFSNPPRSSDLNPIENFFNLISKKLIDDVLENMITLESYDHSANVLNLQLRITALKKSTRSLSLCPTG